jgi:hypothetical protein
VTWLVEKERMVVERLRCRGAERERERERERESGVHNDDTIATRS